MKNYSIMGNLADIFTLMEDNVKVIKTPVAKLKFINNSIDWVNTLLGMLKKIKNEIEGVKVK